MRPVDLPHPLDPYGYRAYSQNDEDGILSVLCSYLAPPETFLEIGAWPNEANCLNLKRQGWSGTFIDGAPQTDFIKRDFVTADNINLLLAKYDVPLRLGVLSIDVDGQDYWIWKEARCLPDIVVIEYNGSLPPQSCFVIPRDPNFMWDGSNYFGASLDALDRLGRSKGYVLVYTNGVNAFFVHGRLITNAHAFEAAKLFKPLKTVFPIDALCRKYEVAA